MRTLGRCCRGWLGLLGALAAVVAPLPAFAADDPFQLPPVLQPRLAPAEPGTVRGFAFEGNTLVPSAELEQIAAPFVGQPQDAANLETLRQRLTRHLISRGYVNSGVLLAEGAVRDGVVRFQVVVGQVREVRLHGLDGLHEDYLRGRLVRKEDGALNIESMRERFQLLLEDPLFERLNARLMPGNAAGDAILDIDVTRARPYQLHAFVSNHRPPSIGENAYGLSGWVRNLSGRGDFLEGGITAPVKGSGGARGNLGWRMPLNTSGTQFIAQFDHGQSSVVEEPLQVLDIRSTLDSKEIGLSQTLLEQLDRKLTLGVSRVRRENRTTLLGEPFSFTPGEPDGVTRIWSWRFWQEYTQRSDKQVFAARSTFNNARTNLQGVTGLAGAPEVPARQYGVWLGQAQYARQIQEQGAQVVARLNVQHARHRLPGLDQLAIGGVNTVRGFRENQLIRDTGVILSLELDYPLVRQFGSGFNMSLVPFYDYGRGKNRGAAADSLSSVGLATRMRWQGFNVDLALAKRLAHPSSVNSSGGTLQDKGFHFRVAYQFFGT
ncbi:MAG TPA: ShlB/FhaC/HecB family hemolysin secretion/activation protein [Burkholderiaceae bacterium]|nr:ShlB/FhaC/HecB family hemolysin secretion/activation protein [Burkholderiaceae bacterium]